MTIDLTKDLFFTHGTELTVIRPTGEKYNKLGDRISASVIHTIGPCSIVDSHGRVDYERDGSARWVGTVQVQAPPDADITIHDKVVLPNGRLAVVVEPPTRPTNPFTGWTPYVEFTLASEGYQPTRQGEEG